VRRSFTYDSLSRLLTSTNPETGTICYGLWSGTNCGNGYDANGNLRYKTDARGVTVNYLYDALNRLISKTYSGDNSATPASCYQYDASPLATQYSVGRLTNQWTQSASSGNCTTALPASGYLTRRSILAYDTMGRIRSEQQCTPSNCSSGGSYSPSYTYYLNGQVNTFSNGISSTPTVGTLTLTNTVTPADRMQSLTSNWNDSTHPATLFSTSTSPAYYPPGELANATLGPNTNLSRTYDNRLRRTGETDIGTQVSSPTLGTATITITGAEQVK
jgi:YD repeat-containing protein